jgi:hypothetical protein
VVTGCTPSKHHHQCLEPTAAKSARNAQRMALHEPPLSHVQLPHLPSSHSNHISLMDTAITSGLDTWNTQRTSYKRNTQYSAVHTLPRISCLLHTLCGVGRSDSRPLFLPAPLCLASPLPGPIQATLLLPSMILPYTLVQSLLLTDHPFPEHTQPNRLAHWTPPLLEGLPMPVV